MDIFRKVTVDDRDILKKYLMQCKYRSCNYSVGNLVLWADVYNTQYAVNNNMLFIKYSFEEEINFTFPIGSGDLKGAFEWLFLYCDENKIDFKMNIVEPEMYEKIESIFPGQFGIRFERDNADYVYSVNDLKNLSGKKYHAKKNYINRFKKMNPNWSYERISDENTLECIEMVKAWCVENKCREDNAKAEEVCVLINGLKYRKELSLIGGVIRSEGKIVALTLGEKLSHDTFIVHFEKAFASVPGAYPMICNQFIVNELSEFTYVNREEDLGIEGLRKSKESYYPALMIEKGVLFRKL